jgi:energy-coupling factor transport system substrate-specific component
VPGGATPLAAFFAPVAAVIGLMAGFWGARGVFQLRSDDVRVGGFLALALGIAAAGLAFVALQFFVGLPDLATEEGSNLFVTEAVAIMLFGFATAWVANRTIFVFREGDARIQQYLSLATGLSAALLTLFVLRMLFGEGGYFSILTGAADSPFPGLNLSGLAFSDPAGLFIDALISASVLLLVWYWARQEGRARLFPVWVGGLTTGVVAAAMSAPISAIFFGGVTGAGTDLLVSLYRTLGLNVFTSVFAQGLTSDPLDKTISYTVVFFILSALPITVRTMYSRGESTVTG